MFSGIRVHRSINRPITIDFSAGYWTGRAGAGQGEGAERRHWRL